MKGIKPFQPISSGAHMTAFVLQSLWWWCVVLIETLHYLVSELIAIRMCSCEFKLAIIMTSLSSHEHAHHGCKENSTHTKFYKIFLHTHNYKWKGCFCQLEAERSSQGVFSQSCKPHRNWRYAYKYILERLICIHLTNLLGVLHLFQRRN